MELSERDQDLIGALRDGLPLTERPFRDIGERLGLDEDAVLERLRVFQAAGVLSRFGVVVRHAEVGYRANAMVVWDVPDDRVDAVGRHFATYPWVNLCYRRPRRLPDWPYNLFTMIHGRERAAVLDQVAAMAPPPGCPGFGHAVLFTTHRFKQTAAHYGRTAEE